MGTVAIQTQCCLLKREEDKDDDGERALEETAVQIVEPVPWRSDGGPSLGALTAVPRSLSEATTIVPNARR